MQTKEQKIKRKAGKNLKGKDSAKGVTLIALVVTIIVLIILAGVSINMVIGNNGIITQAQRAAKETANATIASEEQMNALVEEMEQYEEGWEEEDKPEITVDSLKAGDYIKYNSGTNGEILCRVLYPADSAYGLQIISDKNVKEVTLGVDDNFEASKTSYNSAIETLNSEAEAYINSVYAEDARCVGSMPTVENGKFVDKNSETPSPVNLGFPYNGMTKVDFKGDDENYKTDEAQMISANIWSTGEYYWLATRDVGSVETTSSDCYFRISYVYGGGKLGNNYICHIYSTGSAFGISYNYGLRPCLLLKSNIRITEGDGKEPDTAYTLE